MLCWPVSQLYLKRISELHRSYDPLLYPLLFPNGTDGWHVNLKLQNGRKLTAMVYYRYHIMIRQNVSMLLRAKRQYFLLQNRDRKTAISKA